MCSDALEDEPECVPLMLVRARAHIALRRDLEAQADLRDIIRLDPQCGLAYRLLGELAARRGEHESAAIFFREALRLHPDDREAHDWLQIVATARPAAAAKKTPATAAAAGRFPPARGPVAPARAGREGPTRPLTSATGGRAGSEPAPRFASGTAAPDERVTVRAAAAADFEGPTQPFARGSRPQREPEPIVLLTQPKHDPTEPVRTLAGAQPLRGRTQSPQRLTRSATPELPGFGEYLVTAGILSRERLRAAQAYQRSMKVQLSTAIVTLGLATPQRIEWAAVAHQSQLARLG